MIIVGGGVAGLAAGIYGQKAGFDTVIYEKHSIAGGECTGWDRQGVHIDGCIHWLTGTKPGTTLYNMWVEAGALGDVEIYQPDVISTLEYEGQSLKLYRDLDKLRAHLVEISPDDEQEIQRLCKHIKSFYQFQIPCEKPLDTMNLLDKVKLGLSMKDVGPAMNALSKITLAEYLGRFKSPIIRKALAVGLHETNSAYILPFTLATSISGNGGRPAGGSRAMAKRMEDKYKSLGGELILNQEVKEIVVRDTTAEGVILGSNDFVKGDYVVPTCDISVTYDQLLKGKYQDPQFAKMYSNAEDYPLMSCVYMSFVVDADLSDYPADLVFQTTPFAYEDSVLDQISIKHYCYEPSFAPAGKSVVVAYLNANYEWWKQARQNMDQYKTAKVTLASALMDRLGTRFPELQGKIGLLDAATPITYERYCGAYKGAWMSFGSTPRGKRITHNGRIPGIDNLYMGGQWLMPPGGLPAALVTGKWAVQRLCARAKDNRKMLRN